MDTKYTPAELSIGVDLEPSERFEVDYRSSGEKIEVRNLRAFIDLSNGKIINLVAYGMGIKPDGVIGGGRSKKLRDREVPQAVKDALHDAWDEAAEEISDVEGLVYA